MGGGSAVLGCPKGGGGGSFSISSMGEVWIFSGMTQCQTGVRLIKVAYVAISWQFHLVSGLYCWFLIAGMYILENKYK